VLSKPMLTNAVSGCDTGGFGEFGEFMMQYIDMMLVGCGPR